MKILQINAVYKTKSTGRIAMEMHHYFQSKGVESYVAYATENTDASEDSHVFQVGSWLDHKLHAVAYRLDGLQGCHSTIATKQFLKKIEKLKPDVVLTHNLHSNFLNVPLLLRGLKKMGIATFMDLHDCWLFTGGCYHYTASECNRWLSGCEDCPVLGAAAKKKYQMNCAVYEETRPHIIATSKWLETEAKRSLLGTRTEIHRIYDWIDVDTFSPRESRKIREKYNIQTEKMILGVSTFWSENKGKKEITELAVAMPDATVVLVGKQPEGAVYPANVITIPFTESKEELAELYSAADVFVNPSKQEAFGLVSGEALACGTPLVVYDTTACPEFVTEDTGIIVKKGDSVTEAVRTMLSKNAERGRDTVRKSCRAFAVENFDVKTNIEKYLTLFQEVLSEKRKEENDAR